MLNVSIEPGSAIFQEWEELALELGTTPFKTAGWMRMVGRVRPGGALGDSGAA